MPKTTPAEWLLARITGKTRAAAIYGDLLELAQTRGRFWFWAAYARTLARFHWRPSAAFLLGYLSFLTAMFAGRGTWQGPGAINSYWASMLQTSLAPLWSLLPFGIDRLIFAAAGPLLTGIEVSLCFALPFAAVRYGLRDRFVQLACAIFLTSTLARIYPPALAPLLAIAVMLGTTAALILPTWRNPTIILAATVATGIAALIGLFEGLAVASIYFTEQMHPLHLVYQQQTPWKTISLVALIAPAIVCSSMHRWLLERPISLNRPDSAGAAHA